MPTRRLLLGLLAALTLSTTSGCAWLLGTAAGAAFFLPSYSPQRERALAAGVTANTNTVRLTLEMYAIDHDDVYPPTATWLDVISQPDYLPESRLPANPYHEGNQQDERQKNSLGVAGTVLAPAVAQSPSPVGTVLGAGHMPQPGVPYDALTYGAIVYDCDPARNTFVLYGIGRKGDRAVVSVMHSNLDDE